MLIGEHTAETIKIEIGSSVVGNRQKETQVRGRDVVTGLPKTITLTSDETAEAMNDTIDSMIASAHDVLSETPPNLHQISSIAESSSQAAVHCLTE